MTGSRSRVHRGYKTERNVAEYLQVNGWPFALTQGGKAGTDITGTPGLSIEVKARSGFEPLAWVKQAEKRDGLPFAVMRCNGQGDDAANYISLIRFEVLVELLKKAGYTTEKGETA